DARPGGAPARQPASPGSELPVQRRGERRRPGRRVPHAVLRIPRQPRNPAGDGAAPRQGPPRHHAGLQAQPGAGGEQLRGTPGHRRRGDSGRRGGCGPTDRGAPGMREAVPALPAPRLIPSTRIPAMTARPLLVLGLLSWALVTPRVGATTPGADPGARPARVERWGTFDVPLRGPKDGNPFTDVTLSARFQQGDRVVEVEGFYDGDGIYRVRFMPDALGEWTYRTRSNKGELDGQTGRLICVEPAAGN